MHSSNTCIYHFTHITSCAWLNKCCAGCSCRLWYVVVCTLSLQVISRIAKGDRLVSFVSLFHSFSVVFAMASTPALPAPGGNASAALALANATQPEEMVIHSGAATTEGDMSYLEEDFGPCRHDPRRNMPEFWLQTLTLANSTPSTLTTLTNVPPKWQWSSKVLILLWQVN